MRALHLFLFVGDKEKHLGTKIIEVIFSQIHFRRYKQRTYMLRFD